MPSKIILPILLLLSSLTLKGQTTYTHTVDSLLNLICTAPTSETMILYPRLHKALYEINDLETHLKFNSDFIEAARRASNKKSEAIAYTLKLEALYNYRASDSLLLAESFKALEFTRNVPEADVHYFFTASLIGEIYIMAGNYEEALETAGKFYQEARQMNNTSGMSTSLKTMGLAYNGLEILDKSETSFRESITVANENRDHGIKAESYLHLIEMLNKMELYENAIETNNEFAEFLKRVETWTNELKNNYLEHYLCYAYSYAKLGQYDLAGEYIAKAETIPVATTEIGIYSIEYHRFLLFIEEGKYIQAEHSLDCMQQILNSGFYSYEEALKIKKARGELYYHWGIYNKAADCYKQYINQKDSIQRVEIAEKLHSIRTRYEVDKIQMQQQQDKRLYRSTLTWLSIVLTLLCLIIIVVLLNTRKLRAKNRILAQKAKQWADTANKLPIHQTDNGPNNPEQEDIEIAEKLNLYITNSKLYKDPGLTLENLADKIEINRNKLSRAINRTAGHNFKQYINEFRIREAIRLMDDPQFHQFSLDELMEHVGFNSRSTFYDSFKKITGLTPAQYWKERKQQNSP